MFLTRKRTTIVPTFLSLGLLLWGVGCSTQQKVVYDPREYQADCGRRRDGARRLVQVRLLLPEWRCRLLSTRYPYQAAETKTDTGHLFLDSVTFIAETAFLPLGSSRIRRLSRRFRTA